MKKEILNTEKAPKAIGPYSQGTLVGNLIFTSGQLPINPETGKLCEDIKEAARRSLENVKAVVECSGSKMENVVKVVIFLKNMEDFSKVNEVYGEYFKESYPARSCVQVGKLPMDAKIEIEAVALL